MVTHPGPPCGMTASGSSGARICNLELSAEVLVRCPWESVFPASVPPASPCPDVPFPPRGPMGRFPRFIGTMKRYDSLPPVPPRFVSFTWAVPCGARRSLRPVSGATRVGQESWSPGLLFFPPGIGARRWQGLPGSWVNPDGVHALLSDPGGSSVPGPYGPEDIAFRCLYGVGSSMRSFRGCITRPAPSLSTLRRLGYPSATQDSLPAGGHP